MVYPSHYPDSFLGLGDPNLYPYKVVHYAMAGGVERSTIPTMAGMVSALSGLFANTQLQRMAAREQQLLEDQLTSDH